MKVTINFPVKVTTEISESAALESVMKAIEELKKIGAFKDLTADELIQDYSFDQDTNRIKIVTDQENILDASKLTTKSGGYELPVDPSQSSLVIPNKEFSEATITERLRISAMDPKRRFRLMIVDYKKFYKNKAEKLKKTPKLARHLKGMFISDMMGVFNTILPHIQEGKQLQLLTGMNTVAPNMQKISKELSMAYRKALKQADQGQISRNYFQLLKTKYKEFMDTLIDQVFPGINELIKNSGTATASTVEQTRTHSDIKGSVTVGTSMPDRLAEVIREVQRVTEDGDECIISVKSLANPGEEKSFTFPAGVGMITSIASSLSKSSEFLSDGRVSILG